MIRKKSKKPVEKHKTAAWANIEKKERGSRISVPDISQTIEAKEYVDENEK